MKKLKIEVILEQILSREARDAFEKVFQVLSDISKIGGCSLNYTWAKDRDYYYSYIKCKYHESIKSVYVPEEYVGVVNKVIEAGRKVREAIDYLEQALKMFNEALEEFDKVKSARLLEKPN